MLEHDLQSIYIEYLVIHDQNLATNVLQLLFWLLHLDWLQIPDLFPYHDRVNILFLDVIFVVDEWLAFSLHVLEVTAYQVRDNVEVIIDLGKAKSRGQSLIGSYSLNLL